MADKFAGLCIAGPMAGQQVVNQSQILMVEERPPLKAALQRSVDSEFCPEGIKTHTYRWTSIGPFALWIHESTDLNHALNDMALAYQEKHT